MHLVFLLLHSLSLQLPTLAFTTPERVQSVIQYSVIRPEGSCYFYNVVTPEPKGRPITPDVCSK